MASLKGSLAATFLTVMVASSMATYCKKPGQRLVLNGIGKSADDLRPTVDLFNELLGGDDNGNAPGPLKEGRRSVNWDAGIVPFKFPGDFFAEVVTRGMTVSNADNKFVVSNPEPSNGDDKFSSINPNAAKDFITFSPKRLFSPLKKTKVTVSFSIPGKPENAVVQGFGAVFVDVDQAFLTKAVYFDKYGCVLAKEFVDAQKEGLSFLGVIFDEPIIAKVDLYLGSRPLVPKNGRGDFVVLDDFLYSEPQSPFKC